MKELSKIKFSKLKILINGVEIMNGKENSYVLYFSIIDNEKLKVLQKNICEVNGYKILPTYHLSPISQKSYKGNFPILEKIKFHQNL